MGSIRRVIFLLHLSAWRTSALLSLFKAALYAVSLLAGIFLLSFILFEIVPVDPARTLLGPNASTSAVERLRKELGLDRPLLERLIGRADAVAHLDLGKSYFDGRSVSEEVSRKFLVTARIGLQASLLALSASYLLNLFAFLNKPFSRVLPIISLGVVMPAFFTTVFSVTAIGLLFPQISLSAAGGLVGWWIPSALAALYPLAVLTNVMRENVARTSEGPAYRAARAFGLSSFSLFHRAILRPSAVTWLAVWIAQLSLVFFSSFVLEIILSAPGVGALLLTAIQRRDYPMIQGILLVNASFFILVSFLGELLFSWLDPRHR
jgi:peptide/nickel transport system permease protein